MLILHFCFWFGLLWCADDQFWCANISQLWMYDFFRFIYGFSTQASELWINRMEKLVFYCVEWKFVNRVKVSHISPWQIRNLHIPTQNRKFENLDGSMRCVDISGSWHCQPTVILMSFAEMSIFGNEYFIDFSSSCVCFSSIFQTNVDGCAVLFN